MASLIASSFLFLVSDLLPAEHQAGETAGSNKGGAGHRQGELRSHVYGYSQEKHPPSGNSGIFRDCCIFFCGYDRLPLAHPASDAGVAAELLRPGNHQEMPLNNIKSLLKREQTGSFKSYKIRD